MRPEGVPEKVRHWGLEWNVVSYRELQTNYIPPRFCTELHLERNGRLATKRLKGKW